jgi:hypothetical protein
MYTPEEDARYMRDPDKWPHWPVLPLVERDVEGSQRRSGIMVEQKKGEQPKVWVNAIMWQLKDGNLIQQLDAMASEVKEYESFEALAQQWRID